MRFMVLCEEVLVCVEEWVDKIPKEVDWSKLSNYENRDVTTSSQEFACVAGGCEI